MKQVLAAAAGLAVLYAAVALSSARIVPSYLAAWLVGLSVPVGALPCVMGLELAGFGGALHTGYLRWMLPVLPTMALAGLPILFFLPALYPWVAHHPAGLAGTWFTRTGFVVRSLVYLAIWVGLGWFARRPPAAAARSAACAAGLALHLVVGSLAAGDWIMSLAPGLDAPGFGLLVLSGQAALAVAAGLLLAPARPPLAVGLLLACLAAWTVLQFTQYLIVWSADRPTEIDWYLRRGGGPGRVAVLACAVALVAAMVLLVWSRRWTWRPVRVLGAGLVLGVQVVAFFWLVIPSLRGSLAPLLADALPCLALAGLSAAMLRMRYPRTVLR